MKPPHNGWEYWTVILCKPDAIRRGLVEELLSELRFDVEITARRNVVVTASQIETHYADMISMDDRFPFDVTAELHRNYVGNTVTVALGHGRNRSIARLVRARLGHYDPSVAWPTSIRGAYGEDSAAKAAEEGRFIDNLIHASDDPAGAALEFAVWFGPEYEYLLHQQEPE
uniref:nucleoside-diphosphate kinase n=1 Tax=Herbidospora sakaeratensis TaxID=564415 RepID=UPI0007822CA1|nr:nucleoside-diphosphate kinase [Herbidospora sakaeratensis]